MFGSGQWGHEQEGAAAVAVAAGVRCVLAGVYRLDEQQHALITPCWCAELLVRPRILLRVSALPQRWAVRDAVCCALIAFVL